MSNIKWIRELSDNDDTPVNGQLFDMREPLVFMVDPYGEDKKLVRRNSYVYRLMVEAGWTEKEGKS